MKSLKEVIDGLKYCAQYKDINSCPNCPYYDVSRDGCIDEEHLEMDAAYYLEEYQDSLGQMIELNEPLTWDELKQMKGKPVWVEFFYEDGQHFDSDWFLVGFVSESFCDVIGKLGTSRLVKNDYWQAYKKERSNAN